MMSQARYDACLARMTSVAQKVFAAVPKQEAWTSRQVATELGRLQISVDFAVIGGCLDTLAKSGLIKEGPAGKFCRTPYREPNPEAAITEPVQQEKTPVTPTTATHKPAPAAQTPIDKLGALAARLAELSKAIKETAAAIGDAAVEAQMQMEASTADAAKLKQLQSLLKGMV